METAARNVQGARSTDRVLEALATLAAFLDRTINEVRSLDTEFQSRLLQAVRDAESSIQTRAAEDLDSSLAELRRKLQDDYDKKAASLTADWNAERSRLHQEIDRTAQAALQWEAERARLNSELESARKAAADAIAEAEAQRSKADTESRKAKAAASAPSTPPLHSETLLKEVERVEGAVKQISVIIDDANTELSTVIRKNVERAELESYLKGIRFAITGGNPS
jgi:DNA repair exonuclease SbcCD ATPase subunit